MHNAFVTFDNVDSFDEVVDDFDDTDDAVDGVKPITNDPTSPVASSSHLERKSHQRQNVSFHISIDYYKNAASVLQWKFK